MSESRVNSEFSAVSVYTGKRHLLEFDGQVSHVGSDGANMIIPTYNDALLIPPGRAGVRALAKALDNITQGKGTYHIFFALVKQAQFMRVRNIPAVSHCMMSWWQMKTAVTEFFDIAMNKRFPFKAPYKSHRTKANDVRYHIDNGYICANGKTFLDHLNAGPLSAPAFFYLHGEAARLDLDKLLVMPEACGEVNKEEQTEKRDSLMKLAKASSAPPGDCFPERKSQTSVVTEAGELRTVDELDSEDDNEDLHVVSRFAFRCEPTAHLREFDPSCIHFHHSRFNQDFIDGLLTGRGKEVHLHLCQHTRGVLGVDFPGDLAILVLARHQD
jgi:hypothetical protein